MSLGQAPPGEALLQESQLGQGSSGLVSLELDLLVQESPEQELLEQRQSLLKCPRSLTWAAQCPAWLPLLLKQGRRQRQSLSAWSQKEAR